MWRIFRRGPRGRRGAATATAAVTAASVVVLAVLLCQLAAPASAKGLRMRGGVLGTSRNSLGRRSRKPWSGARRTTYDDRRHGRRRKPGLGFGETDACVGLCYYMKLLELQKRKREEALADPNTKRRSQTTPKPVKMPYEKPYPWERSTETPCVGLCYYYKKKGLPNPFEEWFNPPPPPSEEEDGEDEEGKKGEEENDQGEQDGGKDKGTKKTKST